MNQLLIGFLSVTVPAVALAAKKVEENFPPAAHSLSYKTGDKIGDLFVVGYTGHDKKTLENGLDPKRGIYYGPKEIAQQYANINGKKDGAVALLVSKKPLEQRDHGMQNFEGNHEPISAQGAERVELKVFQIEPVTKENRIGLGGSVERFIAHYFPNTPK